MGSPADIALWFVVTPVLFLIGMIAFVLIMVTFALRLLGRVIGIGGRRSPALPARDAGDPQCRQPRCGHRNAEGSRYCARCGARLAPTAYDVDSYG